jgi:hypothetical protein
MTNNDIKKLSEIQASKGSYITPQNAIKSKRKCRRIDCEKDAAGYAHGIGWERDYCSATCAFKDN